MPSITITLEQLGRFLDQLNPDYTIRRKALIDAKHVLENVFAKRIFTNHGDTDHISSKSELRRLIRAKAKAPKGKAYNEEYLARKRRMGEHSPHKYENYGFWMGTTISFDSGSLVMKTRQLTSSKKKFDYLTLHENRRSVLKATFLRGWQSVVNIIMARYAIEAQR